jgi:hypothetical protein
MRKTYLDRDKQIELEFDAKLKLVDLEALNSAVLLEGV